MSPWTTASNSSCAILVSEASHNAKTEESMWMTAPTRDNSWVLNKRPALPCRGASWEASLATTTRRIWWECRFTTRLGWKDKIARTSSNTLASESVICVWDSYWRSFRAFKPALAMRPKAPWSRKVRHPYNLLAWPGVRFCVVSAALSMPSILLIKRSLIHKEMDAADLTLERSWTRPRKSAEEEGSCCFSEANGYPKCSQRRCTQAWQWDALEHQSWTDKSSK